MGYRERRGGAGGRPKERDDIDDSQFPHRLRLRVRFAETDANRHVSQVSYLIYFEEARTALMAEHVPTFDWFTGDHTLVLVRQWIDYLAPAHFPERLDVWSCAVTLGTSSIRLAHAITRDDAGGTTRIAQGESTMVLVDAARGTSKPWPELVRADWTRLLRPKLAPAFDRVR